MNSFDKTLKFIDDHSPITMDELKILEKTDGLPKFDIFFKQKDDEKTIWGNSKMHWSDVPLRHYANNIYDGLDDGYDIWLRDTPLLENDSSEISDYSIRYAMTLEADNMSEDAIALDFRRVNGWFVISMGEGESYGKEAREFYSKFGIELS